MVLDKRKSVGAVARDLDLAETGGPHVAEARACRSYRRAIQGWLTAAECRARLGK
jgi:hypothetical protein